MYSVYEEILRTILNDVLPTTRKTGFPLVEDDKPFWKLMHPWFTQRDTHEIAALMISDEPNEGDNEDEDNSNNGAEDLERDREPPFQTLNIPVRPSNRATLVDLARSHSFNPLCVYMRGNRDAPLTPAEYQSSLPGAIAQVTFTLSHVVMRQPKPVSHFKATIDEIEILKRPVKISLSLSKAALFRKRGSDGSTGSPRSVRTRAN
ncbi:hypothetical protein FRC12_015393 [Ceratobasidium sp. 428]|nr:hypothetical protein FRC12_015393 [Ceratobasidium sp. 428]